MKRLRPARSASVCCFLVGCLFLVVFLLSMPRRRSSLPSNTLYCHTPPTVSALINIRRGNGEAVTSIIGPPPPAPAMVGDAAPVYRCTRGKGRGNNRPRVPTRHRRVVPTNARNHKNRDTGTTAPARWPTRPPQTIAPAPPPRLAPARRAHRADSPARTARTGAHV